MALALAANTTYFYVVQKATSDRLQILIDSEHELRSVAEQRLTDITNLAGSDIGELIKRFQAIPATKEYAEDLAKDWEELQSKIEASKTPTVLP